MNSKALVARLLAYVRPHKASVIAGIACFFVSAAVEPLLPALLKKLLDSGFKADIGFPVWLIPLVIVGLFAARGMLAFGGAYLLNWGISKAVMTLRTELLSAVMRADASLYSTMSPAVVASRVINDPQNATQSLAGSLTTVLRDGTSLVALLGYLLYVNWQLALVSFLVIPGIAYVVQSVKRRVLEIGGRTYETNIHLVGIVDDVSRAWRIVRTFGAEEFERARFTQAANRMRRLTMKSVAASASLAPLTEIVASAGVALIITIALVQAHRGDATVGEFVAFVAALLMTIQPMRHLSTVMQPIITGLIGAQACFALMDTPPERDDGKAEIDPDRCKGHVRFERVRVQYPGSSAFALDGVDLDIPAGSTVALVGPSGSGKSTVVNAMLGFVSPLEGLITVDGIDVQEVRKASLRRNFAVVSQDIILFDGPIADNVAYAQPRDPQRIEMALRAANLWDFVQTLPDGVETTIGTNGSRLSGGQRQRLAIARALYKQARIWVFDEATSALDTESERVVQQSIEEWHGEKTLVLIAHRLSTVRNADRIYVLADGRVLEVGTHDELMQRGGLYASMVNAQALA